jgi:hypothetical protein
MAKSPTERITELEILVVGKLNERLDNVRVETKDLGERLAAVERAAGEARAEAAVLKQTVEELKKSKELWSNRWWMIITIIVGCLLTSLLSLLVTLLRKQPG